VNSNLPADVRLRWVQPVAEDFHARYSATARTYRYGVLSGPAASALLRDRLAWTWKPLDVEAMQLGANHLLGEQDFSAFRAAACQAQHARREVQAVRCWRQGAVVWFEVRANAFLHHMVRNFMGSLLEVAAGERPPEWIAELLASRDRTQAGVTADAAGLYLVEVDYPERFGLPGIKNGDLESLPWPPSWIG
jgi:tRNA pseudouridine38-40 synthase